VEPFRGVPVIFRHGLHDHRGSISGLTESPRLNRALNENMEPIYLGENGIVLSKPLADVLHAKPGDVLTVEVREGRRPILSIPVIGVSETLLGSPSFMELDTLNSYLEEPNRVSGAYLSFDKSYSQKIYREIKDMPSVAGIALTSDSREAFERIMDEGAGATRYVMALIAAIITFGIVYNAARIAYAERERDLASLRVIGFTRGETAFVLLGELGFVTLAALPIGSLLGYYFSILISEGFSTDLYQVPVVYSPESFGVAGLAVVIATLVSGWFVKRDMDRLEMVTALKSRE
jgi:putative ABC transport system permease protein